MIVFVHGGRSSMLFHRLDILLQSVYTSRSNCQEISANRLDIFDRDPGGLRWVEVPGGWCFETLRVSQLEYEMSFFEAFDARPRLRRFVPTKINSSPVIHEFPARAFELLLLSLQSHHYSSVVLEGVGQKVDSYSIRHVNTFFLEE